ncbi:MAG: DJ-1 family glyoxalase III [Halothiobacillaceae bacterium]
MSKALILMAPGFEELEAISVIDILRRAGVEVVVAGLAAGPLRASRDTVILPDATIDELPDDAEGFDLVVLPGGQPGANTLRDDPRVVSMVQAQWAAGRQVAAICAAPKVLARAGLLAGRRVTHYPGALDAAEAEGAEVTGAAVEVDGKLITGRGPGTALDFALALVEALEGGAVRDKVEQALAR